MTIAERAQGVLLEVVARYASYRGLSSRQARILFEHLRGGHDKQIAAELRCRESTIYEHWRRMAQKCGGRMKRQVINDFNVFVWTARLPAA